MYTYPTVPDIDVDSSPDCLSPDADGLLAWGFEAILSNPMLTERRRSSLLGLIKADAMLGGERSSASASASPSALTLGVLKGAQGSQRRRSSILDLFAAIKAKPAAAGVSTRRRSSFAVLMDSLSNSLFSNDATEEEGAIPGIDLAAILPAPGCGAGAADAEQLQPPPPQQPQPDAKPAAMAMAMAVEPDTPEAKPEVKPGAAAKATAAKPVKTWPKPSTAAKKRKKPESAVVRSLMPRVEKRGRRNPMLEAATVGMEPEDARLEKNRLSARECRIRKKEYLSNLEKTVALFAKKERAYQDEIAELKARLARSEQ